MINFTNSGLSIETFNEIFSRIAADYRAIYGNDISIAQDSPDGQRIGITARSFADAQEALLQLYTNFDLDFSQGEQLNRLLKFLGIQRRPATRSQVDVNITTTRPVSLPANYTLEDDLGQKWRIATPVDINSATTTSVSFLAQDLGAITAAPNIINKQVTIITGVSAVSNPNAAVIGVDEESDADIRRRFRLSTENRANTLIGALTARLLNISTVTDALVVENATSQYDPVEDLDAHHIWCIVEGGAVNDIAEAIIKQKTLGTGLKGSVEGVFTETLSRPVIPPLVINHKAQFDRPVIVDIYVTLTITRKNATVPPDISLIKQRIAARSFRIKESLQAAELYELALGGSAELAPFFVTDLLISDDNITFTDGILNPESIQKFKIDENNIAITEIIP